jgi:hypothetical protein
MPSSERKAPNFAAPIFLASINFSFVVPSRTT